MYPYGDYYVVVAFYELAETSQYANATAYTNRLTAEQNYHSTLASYANGVKIGTTMTTAGAMLIKGNGAILAKETFYNKDDVEEAWNDLRSSNLTANVESVETNDNENDNEEVR